MKISVFFDHILQATEQTGKSVKELLSEIKGYGVDALEINHTYLMEHKELWQLFDEIGLKISCTYEFYDWGDNTDIRNAKEQVDIAKKLGAEKILVIPGFLDMAESDKLQGCNNFEETTEYMSQNIKIQKMAEMLRELVNYANAQNILVTLEDFDDKKAPFATAEQLLWFMKTVNGLYYTFDMGNFAYSNKDVEAAYELMWKYIVHVHCKDRGIEYMKTALEFNKGLKSVPVGHGYLPIKKLIKQLQNSGYTGYFAIEHFDAENQIECIRKSCEFLKQI